MNDYRYEIKYVLDELDFHYIKIFLLRNNAIKTFHDRKVHSLYFDTPFNDFCKENLNGSSERTKVRLRWYNHFTCPTLEFKLRRDRVGAKQIFKIKKVTEEDLYKLPLNLLSNKIFKNVKSLVNYRSHLIPVVYINYEREYFELNNGIRITIDKNIITKPVTVNQPLNFHKEISNKNIIVEIKFSKKLKPLASTLIKNLELSPTRHSKYLHGLTRIGYSSYI